MINLEKLQRKLTQLVVQEENRHSNRIKELEETRDQELERVKNEYEEAIKREDSGKETVIATHQFDFKRRAAGEIMSDLEQSLSVLRDRSAMSPLVLDNLEAAKKIVENLRSVNPGISFEEVRKYAKVFNTPVEVMTALDILSGTVSLNPFTVYSYLGARKKNGHDDEVIVLSPFDYTREHRLVTALEEKVDSVIMHQSVEINAVNKIDSGRKGHYVSARADIAEFTADDMIPVNGFIAYRIKPVNCTPETLVDALVYKFGQDDIQPDAFNGFELRHGAQNVPFDVLEYFMTHQKEDMMTIRDEIVKAVGEGRRLSYEEAAKILLTQTNRIRSIATRVGLDANEEGITPESLLSYHDKKKQSRKSFLNSNGTNPHAYKGTTFEEKKREALERLDSAVARSGESVCSEDIAMILGLGNLASVSSIYAAGGLSKEKRGKRVYTTAAALRDFINSRTPYRAGWMPSTKRQEPSE